MIQNTIKIPGYPKAQVYTNYLIPAPEEGVCSPIQSHSPSEARALSAEEVEPERLCGLGHFFFHFSIIYTHIKCLLMHFSQPPPCMKGWV